MSPIMSINLQAKSLGLRKFIVPMGSYRFGKEIAAGLVCSEMRLHTAIWWLLGKRHPYPRL